MKTGLPYTESNDLSPLNEEGLEEMIPGYETNADIVAGIRQGDIRAESAFVEKFATRLTYILRKRTADGELAADLQQEAFVIVLEKLRANALNEPEKLGAYLQQTAINLYIGHVRRLARQQTASNTDLIEALSAETDQYADLLRDRAADAVLDVIANLNNERDRLIMKAFYIDEKEKSAICAELDLSHRHFDRVISRARDRFRKLVENNAEFAVIQID